MLCWQQKCIKFHATTFRKQVSNQHPNLDRFCSQLGLTLGGFGESRWIQVGTKSNAKTDLLSKEQEKLKTATFPIYFNNFENFRTASFEPKLKDFHTILWADVPRRRKTHPRRSKTPRTREKVGPRRPQTPQDAPKTPPGRPQDVPEFSWKIFETVPVTK